jgi:hypothetical protein
LSEHYPLISCFEVNDSCTAVKPLPTARTGLDVADAVRGGLREQTY